MLPLLVLSLFSLVGISCSSLVSDFHALVELKHGFEFTNPVLSSWDSSNFSSICSSWVGIQCLNGRVVSVDLTDMNLYGSVSAQISRLEYLTNLSLAGNNFTGTLKIESLAYLEWLNVSNNQFSGELNWDYSNFPNLEVFDAYNNNFSANLPLGVVNLKKLRYLDLGGNFFNGNIPKSYGSLVTLEYLSLAGNDLNGRIPIELGNLINLKEIYLGYYNVFEDGIPSQFGNLLNLVHMDLSSCELDGEIPRELGNLKQLDTLYLHINLLSGSIPKQLGNLTNLVNLDLSNNALIGQIPYEFISLKKLKLFNLFINRLHGSIPEYLADFPNLETLGLWRNNFTGIIPQNLGPNNHDHGFKAEIQTLGNIRHRNIVRLLAFCSNKETNLLVFEYMKNGSLGEALHGKKGGILGWNLRYNIAIDAAKGLCYLHHDCSPLIVHRDVKSNNILLDANYEAHVADFGLAKYLVDGGGDSQCMSAIAGSYGYIAPEYAYTLQVDEKSDVYSFGVVLLELISGLRPVGDFGEGVDIVQWMKKVTNCRKEDFSCIVDPRIALIPKLEAMHLFFIAMLCIQENSVQRPTMREVVQMLDEFPRDSPQSSSSSSTGHQPAKKI